MRKIIPAIVVLAALALAGCKSERNTNVKSEPETTVQNQQATDANERVMPDFTLNDMNGKPVSALAFVKGNKITVIDFWASWCGPCRAEMPHVVELYKNYKDKGLGILGVSLDEDEQAWKTAVEKMDMKWQQVSDLKGWENAAAVMFGIQSIPFTMVLDSNGHLLQAGLRGQQLSSFVASQLD